MGYSLQGSQEACVELPIVRVQYVGRLVFVQHFCVGRRLSFGYCVGRRRSFGEGELRVDFFIEGGVQLTGTSRELPNLLCCDSTATYPTYLNMTQASREPHASSTDCDRPLHRMTSKLERSVRRSSVSCSKRCAWNKSRTLCAPLCPAVQHRGPLLYSFRIASFRSGLK